jgi:hypothetical protein
MSKDKKRYKVMFNERTSANHISRDDYIYIVMADSLKQAKKKMVIHIVDSNKNEVLGKFPKIPKLNKNSNLSDVNSKYDITFQLISSDVILINHEIY